jgi:hypothetical protein
LFPLFVTGVVDNGGKFALGVVDTGGKFTTSINDCTSGTCGKFTAGVVDTGGKFADGNNDTSGTCAKFTSSGYLTCKCLREFSANLNLMLLSGALRKMIYEKNLKQKI